MERNLMNNTGLKENIADTALSILEEGVDYHDLAYTTVTFGYLFDIDDHGLEVLFKIVTDVDTFYFAIQGQKMIRLDFTEELFETTVAGFFEFHDAEPLPPEAFLPAEEDEPDEAPGWDAIDAECAQIYPDQPDPKHYAPLVKWRFGGDDPLDGSSVYDAGDYWHFVTYGLSELYEKETEDPEWSGYGMEFTFKLAKADYEDEETEIKVICGILQHIARVTCNSGDLFEAWQYIYTGQETGIDAAEQSNITGFITVPDDKFRTLDTPFGRVDFVEFIGVTREEIEAVNDKRLTVEELRAKLPSDVTDYHRASVV